MEKVQWPVINEKTELMKRCFCFEVFCILYTTANREQSKRKTRKANGCWRTRRHEIMHLSRAPLASRSLLLRRARLPRYDVGPVDCRLDVPVRSIGS